jgi:lysophospholipase L1-like esterase
MFRNLRFVVSLVMLGGTALFAGASRFENQILQFERNDAETPPEPGGIVFVGSSSIRRWSNLEEAFPTVGPVLQRGFGGSRMRDLIEVADRIVFPYQPSVIVVYEGDNDLAAGMTPSEVEADFVEFLDHVRDRLPESRVLILAVKPSFSRWKLLPEVEETNAALIRLAVRRENVEFVDVFNAMLGPRKSLAHDDFVKDGLHLSEKGYETWIEVITPWLEGAASR